MYEKMLFNDFSDVFSGLRVKYAKITIIHVCFIAGSLGRCLITRVAGLVFKQLPPDLTNVNAFVIHL